MRWWEKVQKELVMLCSGMRLVVFNSRMQFIFLANATQSHAYLYSLMLFSSINCSNAHAFHMSSHRVDYVSVWEQLIYFLLKFFYKSVLKYTCKLKKNWKWEKVGKNEDLKTGVKKLMPNRLDSQL